MVLLGLLLARPDSTLGSVRADKIADALGAIACALGLLLRVTARSWKLRAGHNVLVTDGPYSIVRHPLYLGSFLAGFGLCVIVGSAVFATLFTVCYVAIHSAIARKEERGLTLIWPGKYREYAARVSGWIPSLSAAARCWRDCVCGISRTGILKELSAACGVLIAACLLDVWSDCLVEGWSNCRHEAFILIGVGCTLAALWLSVEITPKLRRGVALSRTRYRTHRSDIAVAHREDGL